MELGFRTYTKLFESLESKLPETIFKVNYQLPQLPKKLQVWNHFFHAKLHAILQKV